MSFERQHSFSWSLRSKVLNFDCASMAAEALAAFHLMSPFKRNAWKYKSLAAVYKKKMNYE